MILVVLDGWGISSVQDGNAIACSDTPTFDNAFRKYPATKLYAHGKYVGLPEFQVGNSEAGHMNIGSGRLVEQESVIISRSIKNGIFFKNAAFLGAMRHIKKINSDMHVMGMLSNGQSPHSDPSHLAALLDLIDKNNVKNIYLHLYTDGRDSPRYASLKLVQDLKRKLPASAKIATIMGRFYAMDRKKKWSRTEKAFKALRLGEGRTATSAEEAITEAYNRGESDEFIEPYIIGDGGGENTRIKEGDSIIFFNLRSDRSRQLTKAFVQSDFNEKNPGAFKREQKLDHLYFVAMTDFGPDLEDIMTAFPGLDIKNSLPMQLSDLRQLYIAETEKYAHVTYFFNGGYPGSIVGEDQIMIDSPDVMKYDMTPGMSSKELTRKVINNLKKDKYDFTLLNFAAPDMMGHTGNFESGKKCCHIVDNCLNEIIEAYKGKGGTVIVTADHGNVEEMINTETDEIITEHSTNQVPFIVISKDKKIKLKTGGSLRDIAPTVLDLLGKKTPNEMDGKSLIKK